MQKVKYILIAIFIFIFSIGYYFSEYLKVKNKLEEKEDKIFLIKKSVSKLKNDNIKLKKEKKTYMKLKSEAEKLNKVYTKQEQEAIEFKTKSLLKEINNIGVMNFKYKEMSINKEYINVIKIIIINNDLFYDNLIIKEILLQLFKSYNVKDVNFNNNQIIIEIYK